MNNSSFYKLKSVRTSKLSSCSLYFFLLRRTSNFKVQIMILSNSISNTGYLVDLKVFDSTRLGYTRVRNRGSFSCQVHLFANLSKRRETKVLSSALTCLALLSPLFFFLEIYHPIQANQTAYNIL